MISNNDKALRKMAGLCDRKCLGDEDIALDSMARKASQKE